MESRYVDILVIIDYINMTMYALKIYKEGTRIENSHHQKASLHQLVVVILMSVSQSGGCRPSGGGRSHTAPPKTLHLLSFHLLMFR